MPQALKDCLFKPVIHSLVGEIDSCDMQQQFSGKSAAVAFCAQRQGEQNECPAELSHTKAGD